MNSICWNRQKMFNRPTADRIACNHQYYRNNRMNRNSRVKPCLAFTQRGLLVTCSSRGPNGNSVKPCDRRTKNSIEEAYKCS